VRRNTRKMITQNSVRVVIPVSPYMVLVNSMLSVAGIRKHLATYRIEVPEDLTPHVNGEVVEENSKVCPGVDLCFRWRSE